MDTLVDSTEARIARRIQLERTSRDWSLADLAGKSGVAKASISKIERGEVSPSAGILVRIAAAFDLTLAGLLLRAEETSRLFRRPTSRNGAIPRPAMSGARSSAIPAIRWRWWRSRCRRQEGELSRFVLCDISRHVVWVEEGELVLTRRRGAPRPAAGDSLGFGPPSDVTYANESKSPAVTSSL